MRATRENVAAHAQILRGGEERERAGGGAGEEGSAVQTTGESVSLNLLTVSHVGVLTDKLTFSNNFALSPLITWKQ